MDEKRTKELEFMLRIGSPIPIVECRPPADMEQFFGDHYTIPELISHGIVDFLGKNTQWFYIRPKQNMEVYISGDIRELVAGEIIVLELSEVAKKEFRTWLEE